VPLPFVSIHEPDVQTHSEKYRNIAQFYVTTVTSLTSLLVYIQAVSRSNADAETSKLQLKLQYGSQSVHCDQPLVSQSEGQNSVLQASNQQLLRRDVKRCKEMRGVFVCDVGIGQCGHSPIATKSLLLLQFKHHKLVFQANAITNLTLNMQQRKAIPLPAPSCMIVYATNSRNMPQHLPSTKSQT